MGVRTIIGNGDFQNALSSAGPKLVVVDFGATWCGPCKMIKPHFHAMSNEYTDVVFLEVDEGQNKDVVMSLGIRGFPTFHYYMNGKKVDELVGADGNKIKQKIEHWRHQAFNPFAGGGVTLGSGSASEDPREARLRALGGQSKTPSPATSNVPPAAPTTPQMSEDEQLARALALSQQEGSETAMEGVTTENSQEPKAADVNEEMLSQLLDMGFPDIRARKSLLATSNGGLEACIQWLEAHQDDEDIDEPIKFVDLSSQAPPKMLTEAEKAAKIAELEKRIVERRSQREAEETKSQKVSEIQRREMGKQVNAAREEIEAVQRKHEYEKRRREKEDAKKERERLRAEIAKDKAERRARGGKLGGGVPLNDGASVADAPAEDSAVSCDLATGICKKKEEKPVLSPEEEVVSNIQKLSKYRVGNDGLTAIKTLSVYVKNVVEKPEEEKFRTIKLTNAAFKKRVGGLIGGLGFLKAIGFRKNDEAMVLDVSDRNEDLLKYAQAQLQKAVVDLS